MTEEQTKITYDDWYRTFVEFQRNEVNHKKLDEQYTSITQSLQSIAEHVKEEDRGDLEGLTKQAQSLEATLELLDVARAKTTEKLSALSSKNNLETILGSIESDILKDSVNSTLYFPKNLEKVSAEYKKASELHKQLTDIKRAGIALQERQVNRKTMKEIFPIAGHLIEEYYEEQYPDKEDKYNIMIKKALLKLVGSNEEILIKKFEKIAPGMIKKKEEAFYKEIGGEKNLVKYLTNVLTDEKEIRTYYALLAQIKADKDAQKAQAEQQQRLNPQEAAYQLAA